VKQIITLVAIMLGGIGLSFALNRGSARFLGSPVKRSRRSSLVLATAVWFDAILYIGLLLWSGLSFLYSTLIWLFVSVIAFIVWVLLRRKTRDRSVDAAK
jgi:hypothetical protein